MPRAAAKLYADLNGYFWLPCPICGEHFGGHEGGKESVPSDRPYIGRVVCNKPECNEKAKEIRLQPP